MDRRVALVKWAQTKIGTPFIWGKSDCTTILLEGFFLYYKELLPIDITWLSLKDAIKAFKKYGKPHDILESKEFFKVKRNFEQTGDIFIWQGKGYYLVGFIINGNVMVADEGKLVEMRPIKTFTEYSCYRR